MENYKEMYLMMFRTTTRAIEMLQEVQKRAEELYILEEKAELIVLHGDNKKDD